MFGLLSGLADLVPQAVREAPPPDADYWYGPAPILDTTSTAAMTADRAMRIAACYSSIQVLAQTVGAVPLNMYERLPKKGPRARDLAPEHDLFHVLHSQPNSWQTSSEWREMSTGHTALTGNSYNYIQPQPLELIPLHPRRVQVYVSPKNELGYEYTNREGQKQYFLQDEVFHLRGYSDDGFVGISPVQYQARTLRAGESHEQYENEFFDNKATPGLVLETPGTIADDAKARLISDWSNFSQPGNRHKTVVLEDDLKVHQIGLSNADAESVASSAATRSQIASIWRVPGFLINEMGDTSYNNVTEMMAAFMKLTMLPWYNRWTQAIQRDLISDDKYFAEFVLNGLLQADVKTRGNFYRLMFMIGALSINEIRALENLNPIDDDAGDAHFVPMNMSPVGQADIASRVEHIIESCLREKSLVQNPVTTSPKNETPGAELDVEEDTPGEKPDVDLTPVIESAARRIAQMEYSGMKSREKHKETDPERWNKWYTGWCDNKHHKYVAQTLEPVAKAANIPVSRFQIGPPGPVTDSYVEERTAAIAEAIQEEISNVRSPEPDSE